MSTVAQLLQSKPDRAVYTVSPESTVLDALKMMADKNLGALVVLEGGRIAGLVTERDYARKVALMAKSSRDTRVREIMTTQVMYVGPERTSEECMALMTENRFRHLPVLEGGKLVGL
ncbi:MAG TPA: CBS domain-containing protein, partial [Burkholderiales bacterium]|nr:CBS domain-containing protein [Burkholderiales bacterium]